MQLCAVQLMDHNLIVPSGAIIVDNSLMKVGCWSRHILTA